MSPRTGRSLRNDSYYHIIARGHQEQRLFERDSDYQFYLRLLKRYKKRFPLQIHGFCLLPDHIYIIVKCGIAQQLSSFMQRVNQSYALYFNGRHRRIGRLWRGRFQSILLNEKDLWDCLKSVEFSPVRLNIVPSPLDYPWSSCHHRILGKLNGILDSVN